MKRSLAFLALALAALSVRADLNVGVVISATGPAASVGVTQQRTVQLLPPTVAGEKINYIMLDDASDTSTTVKNVRKLISENKIDVLLGPSLTPNSLALLDLLTETGTPMISLAGSGAIVDPVDDKRKWAFKTPQSDTNMATIVVKHMLDNGVTTVGFISFNDAYGEGWWREFSKLAELRKIKVVANERYTRTDTSVTGQILKIVAANPDAVFIAASGTPAVLPQATLAERGYKGKIYQTHGVANNDFLRVGGAKLEGTFVPAGPVLVAEQLPNDHPAKKPSLEFVKKYEALPGAGARSTFAAYLWDASLLLQDAAPRAMKAGGKPGTPEFRRALRDAIESAKNIRATNGVYNMSPTDHIGLDQRSRVMTRIEKGAWKYIGE
jgi:branched-chain amino acid transport system substrate-binding protein